MTEELTIHFERADKGLGLSIAGGLGSTPYKDNDEGIFISRVTAGGPADIAGLRKDDKVLSVNGHTCVDIDHYKAVGILKAAGANIDMRIAREVVPARTNGHHTPQPVIERVATSVATNVAAKRPPLDSTTTPDDSVSLSSLSQPASSHSQKSLLNKSSAVVSGTCERGAQAMITCSSAWWTLHERFYRWTHPQKNMGAQLLSN